MTPQSSPFAHRVLVVAGDSTIVAGIDALFAMLPGYATSRVPTPAAALLARAESPVDLLIVDLAAADEGDLTELVRSAAGDAPPAVIGLLRHDCPLRTSEALKVGAQECLVLSDLTPARLERQRVQQRLADLALRDELTGLYNRRGLMALGEYQRRQCLRAGRTLVVVHVDVDRLKTINDTLGHQAGDQAIMATASILRCTFRESDIVGRIGGDEFVGIAVDADAAAVHRVQRRLLLALEAHNERAVTGFPLSFSLGASVLIPPAAPSLASLIDEADRALYAMKATRAPQPWPLPAPALGAHVPLWAA
jgi:diguanylate cyclase (GGDEF)-like protein